MVLSGNGRVHKPNRKVDSDVSKTEARVRPGYVVALKEEYNSPEPSVHSTGDSTFEMQLNAKTRTVSPGEQARLELDSKLVKVTFLNEGEKKPVTDSRTGQTQMISTPVTRSTKISPQLTIQNLGWLEMEDSK